MNIWEAIKLLEEGKKLQHSIHKEWKLVLVDNFKGKSVEMQRWATDYLEHSTLLPLIEGWEII